jgi:hypothetical protein
MTTDRDIERILGRWLADGPLEVSDRAFDEAVDRVRRTRQRPAWRLLWRQPPMTTPFRLAAVAAAAILVAVVGISLTARPNDPGVGVGPTPTPTQEPSPSPTRTPNLCQPSEPRCTGLLAAGVHSTGAIITPFTFEVPDGWSKPLDVSGSFNLEPLDGPGSLIGVIPDWVVASQDPCTSAPEPGVGRTVADLVSWLTAHPGLIATVPEPALIGGLDGQVVDIRKDPDWTGACDGAVNLFTHTGTIDDGGSWDINDSTSMRLWFLDGGDGHVVNIIIETTPIEAFDPFVDVATPIVESFDFTP